MESDRDCIRVSRSSTGTGHRNTVTIAPAIVTARWTVAAINPVHNATWPPATPPTDSTIPADAIAGIAVATVFVPDGTDATIEVRNAMTDAVVTTIPNLNVKGDAVIDPATNVAPTWSAVGPGLWTPWDRPFYYFRVNISLNGLTRDSEKDYSNHAVDVLRLNYWHACISDAIADTPAGGGLTTGAEMAEIAGILQTVPNNNVVQQAFNQNTVPPGLWGSILRNTYAYHHASHGAVQCPVHFQYFGSTGGLWNWFIGHTSFVTECPVTASDPGNSVVVLGQTNFGSGTAGAAAAVPVVPRYLMYLDTCVAGWEPGLANALTGRGVQNVIAFQKYIPDGDAREMARNFYRKWANPHRFDPSKISEVFFETGAPYYGSMRPILFGAGGGAIQGSDGLSPAAITGIVLGVVAVAAIGYGLYKLLK